MRAILLMTVAVLLSSTIKAQDFAKNFQIGNRLSQRGLYQKAIASFIKAEQVAKKAYEFNRVYKELAYCYKKISDYNHAIYYYEKLLNIYHKENRNTVILNLSDLWLLTGQYQKVITHLYNMQSCSNEAVRLNNLSAAYSRLGQYNNAITLLNQVIESADSATYRIALQNKGYILWQQNKYQAADSCISAAINLFNDNDPSKYIVLANSAKIKAKMKDFNNALNIINQVIKWQNKNLGHNHHDYIISIRKRAEINLDAGHTSEAIKGFKEFFNLQRQYIVHTYPYMTEQERIDFWHTQKPLVEQCYVVGENDPEFLFDVAVFSKSILTQCNKDFYKLANQDSSLSALYDTLTEIRAKILIAQPADRVVLEEQARKTEQNLIKLIPNLNKYISNLNISGDQICKKLPQNAAAVEFVYYNQNDTMRYAAIVVQKDAPTRFVNLFTQHELENFSIGGNMFSLSECVFETKRANFKNILYNDTILAHKIWDNIVETIPNNADVCFSPDGLLHQIGIEYMCKFRSDLRLHRISSMKQLLTQQHKNGLESVLLIGNIDYNNALPTPYQGSLPDRSGSEILLKNGLTVPFSFLKNSTDEINSARNTFNAKTTEILIKNQADEQTIKQALPKYSTIVLSTHGYNRSSMKIVNNCNLTDHIFADSTMSMCGIVLSGANVYSIQDSANANIDDGLMTALEMSRLNLESVDLIVFSACETNLGAISSDGVFNIPRGLKMAGVNSIIVTLWQINDKSATLIMSQFFKELKAGKNKYDALRSAQEYLRTKYPHKYDSPYHLYPYILIDDDNLCVNY